ncbi:MAG: glycosyltransferase [Saprospiraceae bacterium]|nr:glycosyltransferase [Saprospiraceae bacterium]
MLSILIPVYNQNVVQLVNDIKDQCESLDIQYQIMVFDDLSNENIRQQNKSLGHEFGVNYLELSENLGRAKIRNRLARMARFKHLLFLDGDSGIVRKNFVQSYIDQIEHAEIVYGGRVYQSQKPIDSELVLHWKYGRTREALPLKKRLLDPYLNFQSNNFMITAWLFSKLKFDESVEGYGYEDLLFAQKIKHMGGGILHIDNPVEHQGLEEATQFIKKTKNAVKNLVKLNQAGKLEDVRLTKFYKKVSRQGMKNILVSYFKSNEAKILKGLSSKKPSIWKFNLMKLAEYDTEMNRKK